MTINFIGLLAAITTIITIGFGHIMVRKWEAKLESIKPALLVCVLLGIGFAFGSLYSQSNVVSAMFGIMGITFLWDALEFHRQQKRVIKGHAPSNPQNARHQRILTQYPAATTVSLLNRDPRGYPYSEDEIQSILGGVASPEGDQHE